MKYLLYSLVWNSYIISNRKLKMNMLTLYSINPVSGKVDTNITQEKKPRTWRGSKKSDKIKGDKTDKKTKKDKTDKKNKTDKKTKKTKKTKKNKTDKKTKKVKRDASPGRVIRVESTGSVEHLEHDTEPLESIESIEPMKPLEPVKPEVKIEYMSDFLEEECPEDECEEIKQCISFFNEQNKKFNEGKKPHLNEFTEDEVSIVKYLKDQIVRLGYLDKMKKDIEGKIFQIHIDDYVRKNLFCPNGEIEIYPSPVPEQDADSLIYECEREIYMIDIEIKNLFNYFQSYDRYSSFEMLQNTRNGLIKSVKVYEIVIDLLSDYLAEIDNYYNRVTLEISKEKLLERKYKIDKMRDGCRSLMKCFVKFGISIGINFVIYPL